MSSWVKDQVYSDEKSYLSRQKVISVQSKLHIYSIKNYDKMKSNDKITLELVECNVYLYMLEKKISPTNQ